MNVVKELMGHADINTTTELYSNVSKEQKVHAQLVIEAMARGRTGKTTDARARKGHKSEGRMRCTSGVNLLPRRHFGQRAGQDSNLRHSD